jgi:hypothetical protein
MFATARMFGNFEFWLAAIRQFEQILKYTWFCGGGWFCCDCCLCKVLILDEVWPHYEQETTSGSG